MDTTVNITKPKAIALLLRYGITPAGIGRTLSLSRDTVARALDPQRFSSTSYKTVYRVRQLCERLITAAGWQGDVRSLWREYDIQLSQDEAA